MSSTPIQGPPFASPCIDVPPSLRDSSSSSAVSEIASSHLQTPTSLTPLSLSGRIATVPPPLPLGLSALAMTDQSPHAPHSVGERQTPLPLELPDLNPMPVQHSIGDMDLWDEDAVANLTLTSAQPVQNSPAAAAPNPHASGLASQPLKTTPPRSKSYLKDHPAWRAVNKQAYTPPMLAEIGRLTTGSERCVLWKCQKVGCEKVWVDSVRKRCKAKISTLCPSRTKLSRPPLKTHEAWKAVHKQAYTPEQLEEIGNLTQGSERKVKWKCQKVGCVKVWESTVKDRCRAKISTLCASCTKLSTPPLKTHEAWEAVDTSEYTKEELEEIGNLTQGSDTSVSWRCTTPGCGKKWKSPVLIRVRAKYPVMCNSCTRKGTKRVQKRPEDQGSRTLTKRYRTTEE